MHSRQAPLAGWRTAGTDRNAGESGTPLERGVQVLDALKQDREGSALAAARFPKKLLHHAPQPKVSERPDPTHSMPQCNTGSRVTGTWEKT